jgi:hypothetical protein
MGSKAGLQASGHDDEQLVTRLVSQEIVHYLEVVQIHEQYRNRSIVSDRASQRMSETVGEQDAIGQPG